MQPYPEIILKHHEIMIIIKKELNRVRAVKNERMIHPQRILPTQLVQDFPALGKITKADFERVHALGLVDGPIAYKWYKQTNKLIILYIICFFN